MPQFNGRKFKRRKLVNNNDDPMESQEKETEVKGSIENSSSKISEVPTTPETKKEEKEEEYSAEFMLKNLRLKTIIRENHGQEISLICKNTMEARYSNMIATVGDNQVNVYDNHHFGNNLDIYLHYLHEVEGSKG